MQTPTPIKAQHKAQHQAHRAKLKAANKRQAIVRKAARKWRKFTRERILGRRASCHYRQNRLGHVVGLWQQWLIARRVRVNIEWGLNAKAAFFRKANAMDRFCASISIFVNRRRAYRRAVSYGKLSCGVCVCICLCPYRISSRSRGQADREIEINVRWRHQYKT
jgi:hypothetical protein